MEWHILVYLSYKKSSNNRKNLQHYSQDVNYYETVKKVHKKVIKNFYHLTTCTLPVYGNQMNRASLMSSTLFICTHFRFVYVMQSAVLNPPESVRHYVVCQHMTCGSLCQVKTFLLCRRHTHYGLIFYHQALIFEDILYYLNRPEYVTLQCLANFNWSTSLYRYGAPRTKKQYRQCFTTLKELHNFTIGTNIKDFWQEFTMGKNFRKLLQVSGSF